MPLVHQTTKSTYDRVIRSPRLVSSERTIVLVVGGQSLATNWGAGGAYTPTYGEKIDQISIEDGGTYAYADPALGVDRGADADHVGSWLGWLGDNLIESGIVDRVIFVPCGIGGSPIANFQPGTAGFERLLSGHLRLAAVNLSADAVLFQQGEAEAILGTTQASYQAMATAMVDGLADAGFAPPWLFAKSTIVGNVAYGPVRSAVDALINDTNIFAGPNIDSLTGSTYRDADGTHMNAAGNEASAEQWKVALVSSGLV